MDLYDRIMQPPRNAYEWARCIVIGVAAGLAVAGAAIAISLITGG
jgi:hypothetical protein